MIFHEFHAKLLDDFLLQSFFFSEIHLDVISRAATAVILGIPSVVHPRVFAGIPFQHKASLRHTPERTFKGIQIFNPLAIALLYFVNYVAYCTQHRKVFVKSFNS